MANQDQERDTRPVGKKVDIAEEELMELKAQATQRQRLKTDLAEFEPAIRKMMEVDISLPLVLGWLEKKGKTTTLPALRRYIKNAFGEKFYTDFVSRNGWQKSKKGESSRTGKQLDEKNLGQRATDIPPLPVQSETPAATTTKVERLLPDGSLNPDFVNQCREQTRSLEK